MFIHVHFSVVLPVACSIKSFLSTFYVYETRSAISKCMFLKCLFHAWIILALLKTGIFLASRGVVFGCQAGKNAIDSLVSQPSSDICNCDAY
jgi:hypothetical protein